MLRAEREWFPRFLQLCKRSKEYKNAFYRAYHFLRRVVENCKTFKEVLDCLMDFTAGVGWNTMFLHRRIYRWKEQAKMMTTMLRYKRKRVVRRPSFLPAATSWHVQSSSSKTLNS